MPVDAAWETLLSHALTLIDDAAEVLGAPIDWSFGGGTVLMLRLNHRRSKDVDIFIADHQLLGLFNPRLSDKAEALTHDYDESAGHIKLFFPQGEIDFVVGTTLTENPFETANILSRPIQLERSCEIIAKKMWHRGNRATARDLFDFAAVFQTDPDAIDEARPFLQRNAYEFLTQISARQKVLQSEFNAIDVVDFKLTFSECVEIAVTVLSPLSK